MAINIVEYNLIRFLRENKIFQLGGDLLEVGEANWYGDVDPNMLRSDILKFALPEKQQALAAELDATLKSNRPSAPWEVARIYWETFLQPASRTAIDFHGTETALKLDLNSPIDLKKQYHVVNNCGTLEHVFNVGQAFKTVHDHTLPGGLMIHQTPFVGWIDHGFYNFNPTFFWDLAATNFYHVCIFLYAELEPPKTVRLTSREQILQMAKNNELGKTAVFLIVLRRPDQAIPFRFPMQGFYAGTISQSAMDDWRALR